MTNEQWALVQKTPEWSAARATHERLTGKWRKTLTAKFSRKREAMEARHTRERKRLDAEENAALDALRDRSDKLENEGIRAVFEKYGLVEGRG